VSCLGHTLIGNGWPVLPLCWTDDGGECACGKHHSTKRAGKAPLTLNGSKNATTDSGQVDSWASKWPHANWGVACGAVTVLDIDDAALASQLKKDRRLIAGHFMVATPRGNGLHIYLLEENPAKRTRILISQDGQHLGEIRRKGSYVVGPGSQIAGRPYEALTNNTLVKVEDAEEWTAELLAGFGVHLREAPPQAAQHEREPIDTEGVDADGSLDLALKVLHPERANRLYALLQDPKEWARHPSRSEADYAAVSTLIEAGRSDQEVAAIWIQSPLGQTPSIQHAFYEFPDGSSHLRAVSPDDSGHHG